MICAGNLMQPPRPFGPCSVKHQWSSNYDAAYFTRQFLDDFAHDQWSAQIHWDQPSWVRRYPSHLKWKTGCDNHKTGNALLTCIMLTKNLWPYCLYVLLALKESFGGGSWQTLTLRDNPLHDASDEFCQPCVYLQIILVVCVSLIFKLDRLVLP